MDQFERMTYKETGEQKIICLKPYHYGDTHEGNLLRTCNSLFYKTKSIFVLLELVCDKHRMEQFHTMFPLEKGEVDNPSYLLVILACIFQIKKMDNI
ncbi:TPA: hypothetical protein QCU37_004918 [Bacillus cereus]|nr:hypothetical protein [Bacillus cereus]